MSDFITNPADGSGSPAHQPGEVVPKTGKITPILPDTTGMTANQLRTAYREMNSPEMLKQLDNMHPAAKAAHIAKGTEYLRRANELDASGVKQPNGNPKPGVAAPPAQEPPAELGRRYAAATSDEERAAIAREIEQYRDQPAETASPIDFGKPGLSAEAYHGDGMLGDTENKRALSPGLQKMGVPLDLVKLISTATAPAFDAATGHGKGEMMNRAFDLVEASPGGREIADRAEAFIMSLKPGRLRQAALMACAHPAGIRYLAQLHGR